MKKDCRNNLSTADRPRVLITAGPTHEPIDRVRYLGNRSSGRMGIALAEQSERRGWSTTLLLGPTCLVPSTTNITLRRFQTTAELQELLANEWPEHDLLIMAAAVADYRPTESQSQEKIKRGGERMTLELEPTPDLIAEVSATRRTDQTVIGFALEPENRLLASAREKLNRKSIDAIVANPLETMDAETVRATLVWASGEERATRDAMKKTDFADWLLNEIQSKRAVASHD